MLVDLAAEPELDADLLQLAAKGRAAQQANRKAQLTRDYLIAHDPIVGPGAAAGWSVSCKTTRTRTAILRPWSNESP